MITIGELKEYCKKFNKRFDEHFPRSSFDYFYGNPFIIDSFPYQIGIEFKKGVWCWWQTFMEYDINNFENNDVFFVERYNQNNGKSIKTVIKGIDTELKIKELLTTKLYKNGN